MAQVGNTRYSMCEQKMVPNTATMTFLSCPEDLKSLRSTQGRRSHHPPLSAQTHLHGVGPSDKSHDIRRTQSKNEVRTRCSAFVDSRLPSASAE